MLVGASRANTNYQNPTIRKGCQSVKISRLKTKESNEFFIVPIRMVIAFFLYQKGQFSAKTDWLNPSKDDLQFQFLSVIFSSYQKLFQ